jgi:hypothetical protein
MKIGSIRSVVIEQGANKGKTVHCRTIWLQPGERQPALSDLAEMQDMLQAAHPGDLVSVQTRLSSFAAGLTTATAAVNDDEAT